MILGEVTAMAEAPFDSLEAAHEYVGLLLEAVRSSQGDVAKDVAAAIEETDAGRRREALQLVAWKLQRLETHLAASRKLVNDLRRLRRLLLGETGEPPAPHASDDPDDPWHSS
jgi:hypothetical protein